MRTNSKLLLYQLEDITGEYLTRWRTGSKQLIVSLRKEAIELLEELRKRKLSKQEVVKNAVSEYIEREARKYGLDVEFNMRISGKRDGGEG